MKHVSDAPFLQSLFCSGRGQLQPRQIQLPLKPITHASPSGLQPKGKPMCDAHLILKMLFSLWARHQHRACPKHHTICRIVSMSPSMPPSPLPHTTPLRPSHRGLLSFCGQLAFTNSLHESTAACTCLSHAKRHICNSCAARELKPARAASHKRRIDDDRSRG